MSNIKTVKLLFNIGDNAAGEYSAVDFPIYSYWAENKCRHGGKLIAKFVKDEPKKELGEPEKAVEKVPQKPKTKKKKGKDEK